MSGIVRAKNVIVVSWFLQCMGYVQYEGSTYPMHCKNHETAVLYNRPRKATARH